MKYLPLVWSAIWRKPTEAVLIWLAVTTSFTLFGSMLGLHAAYDQIVENARMDRLNVNVRFPGASPTGILMPFALRDQILKVKGVSAVGTYVFVRGYYRDPHHGARVIAVDDHMREASPELLLNSAQAVHICSLEEFHAQHSNTAQLTNDSSAPTFCAICASSHSPSLAVPIVSLSHFIGPTESPSTGQVDENSALPLFSLSIRPPPVF